MRSLFVAGTVLALASGAVFAQAVFEDLDTDRNGYISRAEAAAETGLYENFDQVDGDGNGTVNIDEFVAYRGAGRFTPPEESEVPEIGAAPTK